jgi:hypothetical protein
LDMGAGKKGYRATEPAGRLQNIHL